MRAALLLLLSLCLVLPACAAPPKPDRVSQIAAWLPAQPTGVGRPLTDRAVWDGLAASETGKNLVTAAAALLGKPLPEQPDELFLQFSQTGNRTNWQRVSGQRRNRLPVLVLAECLEHKGRFLPAIGQLTEALCAERTWVMPAHDGGLQNFQGKTIDIDLASSALGWEFATAAWLLGDTLPAATRQLIAANVQKRVTEPFLAMVREQRPQNWWMNGVNNWNAVCLAGATGTCLAALDSVQDRATAVAGAEEHIRSFLRGFNKDGYCTEGLGYWGYGFGRFVLLSETLVQATGGKIDLLGEPAAKEPALFPVKIELQERLSPAFADCDVHAQPPTEIMTYLNRRFGWGLARWSDPNPQGVTGSLFEAMLFWLPNSLAQRPAVTGAERHELRDYFQATGILIARPQAGSGCRLAVALKGGNNAEQHNHNDVGSFVVALGASPVLLDPGAEVYTARTFSARRYESNLLNSFGHSVPKVAGKLQQEGAESQGKVLEHTFTDQTDTLKLDIASAYRVKELTKLERTWVYSRVGEGSLTVSDSVAFTSPQAFETALITAGSWRAEAPNRLLVHYQGETVRVEISTDGGEFTVLPTEIHEETSLKPIRLGIVLRQPVSAATLTCRITPVGELPGEEQAALHNGGFELGEWFWTLPTDGLGAVSEERAASGKASLKLVDHDKTKGSNINSARFALTAGKATALSGKFYPEKGSGIGLYVYYLDAAGQRLNVIDANGNMAPVGTLDGKAGQWNSFRLPFTPPAGTVQGYLWIHSFNGAEVDAFLDDLKVE